MQLRLRGSAASAPWRVHLSLVASLITTAFFGCAHHRADQYSYAPPYAPPVYTQPQSAAQPVAYSAPAAMPAGAVPAGVVTAPAFTTGATTPHGEVVVAAGSPCPPCEATGTTGVVVGAGALVEGGGQTPPCPPGP